MVYTLLVEEARRRVVRNASRLGEPLGLALRLGVHVVCVPISLTVHFLVLAVLCVLRGAVIAGP